jgi:hypothetical protein
MTMTQTAVPPHVQLIQMGTAWTPHFGKLADMVMLAMPGGEERTPGEYQALLAAAKLRMIRVVPTGSDVSIVEAELA